MSAPSPVYVLTRDLEVITIEGAVGNPTITPRPCYDGDTHNFGLSASEVGGGMGGAFSAAANDTPPSISIADAYYATAPSANTVLALHDMMTLTAPRPTLTLVDYMEWWDTALTTSNGAYTASPGFAQTITITGDTGDLVVTVSSFATLTRGQAITGANTAVIDALTTIVDFEFTPAIGATPPVYKVLLSRALAGTATTGYTATLLGGNLRGRVLASRFKAFGTSLPTSLT